MDILHITEHMGGGVGKAISSLVCMDNQNNHRIICLEKLKDETSLDKCTKSGVKVLIQPNTQQIADEMAVGKIIILHWWDHPGMCSFLYHFPCIPVRMILWSHISGCVYPYLTPAFARRFQRIFWTSPYSMENPGWSGTDRNALLKSSQLVYGLGHLDFGKKKSTYDIQPGRFVIGYVGTFSRSKMHPQFVEMCGRIIDDIPQTEIVLIGEPMSGAWIRKEAAARHIKSHFNFYGYQNNVQKLLTDFDVFGYPLNPDHFGTTENAVLEAMAAGLPVVMLNQATEKYILSNYKTGILATDIYDYSDKICMLCHNHSLRKTIGQQARLFVMEEYDINRNLVRFQQGLDAVYRLRPHSYDFRDILGGTPYEWFLSGLNQKDNLWFRKSLSIDGSEKNVAQDYIFNSRWALRETSKSSIRHFAATYPDDPILEYWSGLIQ